MPASEPLADALARLPGVAVRTREPLDRHTPLRVGGPADLWVIVADLEALKAALRLIRTAKAAWRVHWPLSDWLVREGGLPGAVVRPGRGFEQVGRLDGDLVLGAAATWACLATLGEGWWSPLAAWPGTVGGLLASDDRRWLAGHAARIEWLKGRSVEVIELDEKDEIPEVPGKAIPLRLVLRRGLSLVPESHRGRPPGPGVLFSDPDVPGQDATAAATLERTGMLGTRLRDWRMSEVEPGTLIQLGGGTTSDALLLAQGITKRVESTRGVLLERRIPVIGRQARHGSSPATRGRRGQP